MKYKEIKGNLISLALQGEFDVIAHGCNCFCTQKSGLAPQMVKAFGTDYYPFSLENSSQKGKIDKLGRIESTLFEVSSYGKAFTPLRGGYTPTSPKREFDLWVVNAYTQYNYGKNYADGDEKPLDYEALTLCMRKINHEFKGSRVGLPQIGSGLAGGDWNRIKNIIQEELKECKVTVVIYDKNG